MIRDADRDAPAREGSEPASAKTVQIGFVCPPGFEPAAFMVVAMDKEGRSWTNAPQQPNIALHLGTLGLQFVSQRAVMALQEKDKNRIVPVPSGIIPPWPGPAGRG